MNYKIKKIKKKVFNELGYKESIIGTTSSFYDYCTEFSLKKGIDLQEMEAASVGKVAFLMGKQFLVIKIVSNLCHGNPEESKDEFIKNLDKMSDKLAEEMKFFLTKINELQEF